MPETLITEQLLASGAGGGSGGGTTSLAEDEIAFYLKATAHFAAVDPDTKTLQLSPAAGKIWHLSQVHVWTNEQPPDNSNAGSYTNIDVFINGTTNQIARQYATEMLGSTYRSSGLAFNCQLRFGQRLLITEQTNGIYVTATHHLNTSPYLYLEIEGTETDAS